jgi:hypothetical protein
MNKYVKLVEETLNESTVPTVKGWEIYEVGKDVEYEYDMDGFFANVSFGGLLSTPTKYTTEIEEGSTNVVNETKPYKGANDVAKVLKSVEKKMSQLSKKK